MKKSLTSLLAAAMIVATLAATTVGHCLIKLAPEKSGDGEALEAWRKDEEVDALNNSLFRELLTYMMGD